MLSDFGRVIIIIVLLKVPMLWVYPLFIHTQMFWKTHVFPVFLLFYIWISICSWSYIKSPSCFFASSYPHIFLDAKPASRALQAAPGRSSRWKRPWNTALWHRKAVLVFCHLPGRWKAKKLEEIRTFFGNWLIMRGYWRVRWQLLYTIVTSRCWKNPGAPWCKHDLGTELPFRRRDSGRSKAEQPSLYLSVVP